MDPINVDDVELAELTSSTSDDAAWVGGFFAHGGDGAAASTVIYFAVPEGKRLGRHTDTAEETQFILGGEGSSCATVAPIRSAPATSSSSPRARPTTSQHGLGRPAGYRILLGAGGAAALDLGGVAAGRPRRSRGTAA